MGMAEPNEERMAASDPHRFKDRYDRRQAAVAMRVAGATYTEIAKALEYASGFTARRAVEAALAATVGEDSKDQLRAMNSRRLERLLTSVWRKATNENHPDHLAAVRTGLMIIDRHIRLYGLDAPTEVVMHNPTLLEIEAFVAKAAAKINDYPEETEMIQDAEVVEAIEQ